MRDGRATPVGVHKEISRERQIAFGDHLVSKMQLFHTDMADEEVSAAQAVGRE